MKKRFFEARCSIGALEGRTVNGCALTPLVHEIARGDDEALTALYHATVVRLLAASCSVLRSKQDAEEIVCDVFVFVWRNAHRYDQERGPVMAWLTVMTRNRSIDRLRQRHPTTSLDDERVATDVPGPRRHTESPDRLLSTRQQYTQVHGVLAKLPALRRELISLAFLQGRPHEEIAALANLPLGTVKSHIRRGLQVMRQQLEQTVA